ncbi:MAG: CYTH domain-containing protein [Clostridiales bacterium]|nr:CYTH domain-containing protein [Clostridiales bacterium]
MKNIEQELKMALNEREYNILLDVGQVEPQLQTNYYFRYKAMPNDMMIRLRRKGDQYLLCYKQRLSHQNGVAVSDERECEVSKDFAHSLCNRGITQEEAKDLLGVDVPSDLQLVGSMDTYRAKFQIEQWTLELDKNEYAGIVDYELECENLYVEQLEKLKNYLFYAYGIIFRHSKPKIQRFLLALKQISSI